MPETKPAPLPPADEEAGLPTPPSPGRLPPPNLPPAPPPAPPPADGPTAGDSTGDADTE